MNWRLVENLAALQQVLERNADATAVAIDTEFMRRSTFYPQAALVQLCFPGEDLVWLLDPTRIEDFSPLIELFRKPSVMKILHSPSEDLEVFQQLIGVQPLPLFDTQRAAAFLDMGYGLSYPALVKATVGQQVTKSETRSDWLARPLTAAQREYAAQDVLFLPEIYRQLLEPLAATGKLEWLLEEGEAAAAIANRDEGATVRRIKSAWKLDRQQLAVLMTVIDWRERRARQVDKPRGWILSDRHCLGIARCIPGSLQDFHAIEGFPSAVLRKQGAVLLELVARARALEEQDLPQRLAPPLNGAQRSLLKQLKAQVRRMAKQWDMAAEILLPARDYEVLVRKLSGEPVQEPEHWCGWRARVLLPALLTPLHQAAT